MTPITYGVGGIVTAIGLIAYIATGAASWTALIPAFIGVLILIAGCVAAKPDLHKHGIHAALVIALVGAAGTVPNVLQLGDLLAGNTERPAAVIASTATFIVLVVYIVLGVRSFIAARKAQTA